MITYSLIRNPFNYILWNQKTAFISPVLTWNDYVFSTLHVSTFSDSSFAHIIIAEVRVNIVVFVSCRKLIL